MSLSKPTSSKEVVLRDKNSPPNVIPFPEYVAKRQLGLARARSPRAKREPWENNLISRLYWSFIRPHFPQRISIDHYHLFLSKTLPFLVRSMCFEAVSCLCNWFYHRNEPFLLSARITYKAHTRRCMAVIAITAQLKLPYLPQLKKPRHREAYRILWALALHKGEGDSCEGRFFIASRDLQARMFLPNYKAAQRILEKLCALGVLLKLESGQTRWEAKAQGKRAEANSYRLVLNCEGSRS